MGIEVHDQHQHEMNYWPAELTNLADCVTPLIAMVKDIGCHRRAHGAHSLRLGLGRTSQYRSLARHRPDRWAVVGHMANGRRMAVQTPLDHFDYARDNTVLAEIYPVMRDAAVFFLDTLVEEPTHGWLVTSPSLSPENVHPFDGVALCAGPAMDSQILRDLFANCIAASEILNVDADLRAQFAATRARLPPDQIGKGGQLQEWLEDWTWKRRSRRIAMSRTCTVYFRANKSISDKHPIWRKPHAAHWNCAGICRPAGQSRGA